MPQLNVLDFVSIDYGNGLEKAASVVEREEDRTIFRDGHGLFCLTDKFVLSKGIKIIILADV